MKDQRDNRNVGQKLNNLHRDLVAKERQESMIIRLRATVGEAVSPFTERLTGRAKGKKIAVQFEMLCIENMRLIPDPRAWSIFSEWVHHHKLVGALRGMDLRGKEDCPPTDWLPDHPVVTAAQSKNVRTVDGSKFFEPYPVNRDGIVTIARYDEVIKCPVSALQPYLEQLEDVRRQLAIELTLTKSTGLEVRSAAKVYGAALPFAPEQVIRRKKPSEIAWKSTTKLVTLPASSALRQFTVFAITITEDGSMCHHIRRPEAFLGNRRIQRELTLKSAPGLPMMEHQPQQVLGWMEKYFEGLETAESPLFPKDFQGTYTAHVVNPLGVSTAMRLGMITDPGRPEGGIIGRKIPTPARGMQNTMERAFASAK